MCPESNYPDPSSSCVSTNFLSRTWTPSIPCPLGRSRVGRADPHNPWFGDPPLVHAIPRHPLELSEPGASSESQWALSYFLPLPPAFPTLLAATARFSFKGIACGIPANQLPVTRNCGVPTIQLLASLKTHHSLSPLLLSIRACAKKVRRRRKGSLSILLPSSPIPVTLTETVLPTVFRWVLNGFPPGGLTNPL